MARRTRSPPSTKARIPKRGTLLAPIFWRSSQFGTVDDGALHCLPNVNEAMGQLETKVIEFDKLDARSQSALMSGLVHRLICARCDSLRELSARAQKTPTEVWRSICLDSGVEPCSIPSHIAGKTH